MDDVAEMVELMAANVIAALVLARSWPSLIGSELNPVDSE